MTELRKARKTERQSGQRNLFPVRLVDYETLRDCEWFDADSGKGLAVSSRIFLTGRNTISSRLRATAS